jgi:hypothetical protein
VSTPKGERVQLDITRDELRWIVACGRHDTASGPLSAAAKTFSFADKLRGILWEGSL